ncbi:hypothetical protein BpHYR1_009888 [Brachionus plicatilis]|uniref:Uncharacterized protein n=1 Tax=Brachionus plicatilis TaxID=10195 RepID=A0A3M7QJX5_BRAPC|nr:hypothetical protein BpHYR1_009888 [Brachionus plicatilis]
MEKIQSHKFPKSWNTGSNRKLEILLEKITLYVCTRPYQSRFGFDFFIVKNRYKLVEMKK